MPECQIGPSGLANDAAPGSPSLMKSRRTAAGGFPSAVQASRHCWCSFEHPNSKGCPEMCNRVHRISGSRAFPNLVSGSLHHRCQPASLRMDTRRLTAMTCHVASRGVAEPGRALHSGGGYGWRGSECCSLAFAGELEVSDYRIGLSAHLDGEPSGRALSGKI